MHAPIVDAPPLRRWTGFMRVLLEVMEGPDQGSTFEYEGTGPFVLGRGGTADSHLRRLTDPTVSREHLLLSATPGRVIATAVKACNPLHIAGVVSCRATLGEGDEFRIGKTVLRVHLETGQAETTADLAADPRLPRRQLSEFVLGDEIGRGAFGRVYEAVDLANGDRVAVKVFQPDLEALRDPSTGVSAVLEKTVGYFLREMDIVAALDHPNLSRTIGVGRGKDELFLVMDLIEGATLSEYVRAHGPMPADVATTVAEGLLSALQYAHDRGIVHRDVCPSNVMIEELDGEIRARVLDFGIAKERLSTRHRTLTRTGDSRGQVNYMAPECVQHAKTAGPAADVFGAGATLYFALTRKRWYRTDDDNLGVIESIRRCDVHPLSERVPDAPAGLVAAIEGALRAAPEDRWPSAGAMLGAIRGTNGDLETTEGTP